MARATFVKAAQKDYPEHGIKKGESYWWWKFRHGSKRFSKIQPKQSQLTQSEFLSGVWSVEETLGALSLPNLLPAEDSQEERERLVEDEKQAREDYQAAIDDAVSELESIRDDTQSKYDNMPEPLQQGETGQLLEDRIAHLEQMISDLEAINTEDDDLEEVLGNIQGISYEGE